MHHDELIDEIHDWLACDDDRLAECGLRRDVLQRQLANLTAEHGGEQ